MSFAELALQTLRCLLFSAVKPKRRNIKVMVS